MSQVLHGATVFYTQCSQSNHVIIQLNTVCCRILFLSLASILLYTLEICRCCKTTDCFVDLLMFLIIQQTKRETDIMPSTPMTSSPPDLYHLRWPPVEVALSKRWRGALSEISAAWIGPDRVEDTTDTRIY